MGAPAPRPSSCSERLGRTRLVALVAPVPSARRAETGSATSGVPRRAPASGDGVGSWPKPSGSRAPEPACLPACCASWAGPTGPLVRVGQGKGQAEREKEKKACVGRISLGPDPEFAKKSLFRPPELSRQFQSTPCHKSFHIFPVLAPIHVLFIIFPHNPPTTTLEDPRSTSFLGRPATTGLGHLWQATCALVPPSPIGSLKTRFG